MTELSKQIAKFMEEGNNILNKKSIKKYKPIKEQNLTPTIVKTKSKKTKSKTKKTKSKKTKSKKTKSKKN
jgi:hypothetical protein